MSNAIITAVITATGPESTVPDNEQAADALIALDGKHLCCVTLIDGSIWGSVDHWCDRPDALDHDDIDRDELIAAIEEAFGGAMTAPKGTASIERF